MQYMSEYCAHRPEDAGCLLVVPFFRRSVGERTKLTLHKAAIAPYAELGFVPSSCSCGAGCAEDEFFATFSLDGDWFELGDAATISLTPPYPGSFRVCAGGAHIASLIVDRATCPFEADDASPCSADECAGAGATEELCMQIVAEYCSDHPSDQGCEFMILRFERTLGEQARIEIHFKGLGPTVEAKFVPEACACDGSCKANEVDVIATSYDAARIHHR
jgi:hypothetical protein